MSTTAAAADLKTVDLMDPEFYADGPPHEIFARMRAEAPVHWSELGDGDGFWSLTKAEDIAAVSKDSGTYSSNSHGVFVREDVPLPVDIVRAVILGKDPPEHTRYRGIVQKVFTPSTINKQEDKIRARVTRLIDAVCEKGECDFVRDIAVELPLQTIAEILGVPHEDRGKLFEWTNRIEAAHTEGSEDGLAAFGEMAGYLHGLIEQRRQQPADDLITALMNAEVDGERLNDLELNAFFGLLMFAGNDTTRNTSSGGLLALLEHPDHYEKLCSDPALIPGGVEEMLRWVTPVMWFRRTPTRDVEIRGTTIKEGSKIVIWYASGSRDEDLVEDPMRFDVTREKVEHQAFGGGGRHFCLGSSLARLQLRILFEELTRRLPDMELAGPPKRTHSNWVNGLDSLPVKFTPTKPEGGS
jgi:methyl-branched lipid omega-hydroxylase